MIKLIVGLGNPGSHYAATRHNAGAWFTDEFAQKESLSFKLEKKFHLQSAEYCTLNQSVLIIKPITYMNESGIAVASIAKFYQIQAEEILIVHDELDFVPGVVRLKKGGGHGGHNGLRDIIARLGSNDFYRLRLGIGHPGQADKVAGYVLQNPRLEEKIEIDHAIIRALDLMPELFAGSVSKATKCFNSK